MPTGYTADVADGKIDFRTFALRCARQFGATVMQREEGIDSPPRHREVSTYNSERLVEAQAEVERLRAMSPERAQVEMEQERAEHENREARYRAENVIKRQRYEQMMSEVEQWSPPSDDHLGLKTFMLGQLRQSIDFDCNTMTRPFEHTTAEGWHAAKLAKAVRDVEYHAKAQREEEERVSSANIWIDALYESLPEAQRAES